MNIFKYLAPLLVAPSLTFAQSSLAQNANSYSRQKLSLSVKPSVVQIWNPCVGLYINKENNITQDFDVSFVGTGFFINPDGYIVTSAHVMTKDQCLTRLARNINQTIKRKRGINIGQNKIKEFIKEDDFHYYDDRVILPNPNLDPFPIKVKSKIASDENSVKIGDDVAIIKISVTDAPTLELGESGKVNIQDKVLTAGYPINIKIGLPKENKVEFTNKSYYEASIQEGSIASTAKQIKGGYPILQVDIQAKRGSAGSPLVNQDGQVVGMLVTRQYDQSLKDDIPLAITTDTIQEAIDDAGTTNDIRGTTNLMYREGLDLYVKKKYKEAKKLFLDVKDSYKIEGISAHSEVQKLIDEIERIEANRWANPWKNPTNLLLLALLVGGGIVGAVAYFLLRQRQQFATATAGDREGSTNADSAYNPSYKRNGKGKKCFMEMEYKGQIQRFQLGRSELRLGRDPAWSDLDIPTSWEVISRRHGILKKEGDDYRIFDGDRQTPSRNGLWVNDDFRVDPQDGYLLKNGDRLKIGQDQNDQVLITYFNPNQKDDGGSANPKTTMAN